MNYIDYHVVYTTVMCGLGIVFFVSVLVGLFITVEQLFNEKDDE